MGRFSLTFLLLATGCIDRSVDAPTTDIDESSPSAPPVGSVDETTGRPKPYACGNTAFAADNTAAMNISLAGTHGGAALFGVPSGGGSLMGYRVQNGKLLGTATKLRTDEQLVATSSTFVEDYLVVASVTNEGSVLVDRVTGNLGERSEITKVEGTAISKVPVLRTPTGHVLPTVDSQGLHLTSFDASWSVTKSELFQTLKPPTGVSGINLGDDALVAWSAANTCNVLVVNGGDGVTKTTQSFACDSVRLAADSANGIAMMVFDSPEGVKIAGISHHQLGTATLLRGDVKSPRIAFDGQQFWVSFIDARNQVVIGYLDQRTMDLTSIALPGMWPETEGFELEVIDGKPWVFAADAGGFASSRVCMP